MGHRVALNWRFWLHRPQIVKKWVASFGKCSSEKKKKYTENFETFEGKFASTWKSPRISHKKKIIDLKERNYIRKIYKSKGLCETKMHEDIVKQTWF